jgi:MIP family channel proteins
MSQGLKSCWAEFLGTFALCFIGQGAIITQHVGFPGAGLLGIAVAHGLALAVMISALGAVSGGHFNPAVTLSLVVTGRQSAGSAAAYWVSQLVGAVVASYLLVAVFPAAAWQPVALGAARLFPELTAMGGALVEFVLTFFLVTAVWGTAVDERHPPIGGFGIGLAVTMGILAGGMLTGGAMNPARAFGPALAAGAWADHWIWWVGPLLGGAAAGLVYNGAVLGGRSRG